MVTWCTMQVLIKVLMMCLQVLREKLFLCSWRAWSKWKAGRSSVRSGGKCYKSNNEKDFVVCLDFHFCLFFVIAFWYLLRSSFSVGILCKINRHIYIFFLTKKCQVYKTIWFKKKSTASLKMMLAIAKCKLKKATCKRWMVL